MRGNMFEYIVVQAGGKGTRLKHLTKNKPKCLVSIDNLPMLFHLFKLFPDKKFIIIGDYKFDVLEKYLGTFAKVDYQLVCASGHCGTLSGIKEALSKIPSDKSFMLIWSDLVLEESDQPKIAGGGTSLPFRKHLHADGVMKRKSFKNRLQTQTELPDFSFSRTRVA